jgi:hypothetical protein
MLLLFGYLLLLHYYVDIPIDKNEFENIFSNIEDGFIICTLGNNLWSDYFARLSTNDKRFSHLGIIRVCDGNISVVHSAGTIKLGNDFVKEDSFNIYIANVRAIGIYKINSIESYKIGQEAINLIGVPFDWQFDMLDDSKLYCTELLYVILKSIDPSIELQTIFNNEFNCNIIPLEAISNSDYFEEIFYIDNLLEEVKK